MKRIKNLFGGRSRFSPVGLASLGLITAGLSRRPLHDGTGLVEFRSGWHLGEPAVSQPARPLAGTR